MPCEELSRPLDVVANLIRQLQRRSELLLAPQQLVKVHAYVVVVDIRIEIEDVALDRNRVILVERRPHADVRDALETTRETLEARRRDVDTAAGVELVRRIDVDGRKSDLAPEAAAG